MHRLAFALLVVSAGAALLAGPAGAGSQTAPGLPAKLPARLFAAYGNRAFVPTWIPRGYLYLKFSNVNDHSSQQTTYDNLNLEFGRAGSLLEWTVSTPTSSFDCLHPYANRTTRLNGLEVSFASGNHGQSAWTCVGQGLAQFEIGVWDPHTLSPATLMQVVASAQNATTGAAPASSPMPARPTYGVPATYVGAFNSVDGRERCTATNQSVLCISAISGQAVRLSVNGPQYLGKGPHYIEAGARMPEGTSFTTPSGAITCSSGSYGIRCVYGASAEFYLGDRYVRLIGPSSNRRIPA